MVNLKGQDMQLYEFEHVAQSSGLHIEHFANVCTHILNKIERCHLTVPRLGEMQGYPCYVFHTMIRQNNLCSMGVTTHNNGHGRLIVLGERSRGSRQTLAALFVTLFSLSVS